MGEAKRDTKPVQTGSPPKDAQFSNPANSIPSVGPPSSHIPTDSYLFSQLPTELRSIIWSYALQRPPRLIELAAFTNYDHYNRGAPSYPCKGHWRQPYLPRPDAQPRPYSLSSRSMNETGHLCFLHKPAEILLMSVCRESRLMAQKKYSFMFNTEQDASGCKFYGQCGRQLQLSERTVMEGRPQIQR